MKKKILSILLVVCMAITLLPAAAFAQTPTHSSYVIIAGTIVGDGDCYYFDSNGDASPVLPEVAVSCVSYSKSTGTVTFKNTSITTSTNYALTVAQDEITTSGELIINLIGENTLTVTGAAGGIYAGKMDCKITGTGSLTVSCEAMSAMQLRSLTVNDPVTLNVTANGPGTPNGIETTYDVVLTNGKFDVKVTKANSGISSSYGNITVSDNAEVKTFGYCNGVHCGRGVLTVSCEKFEASANVSFGAWATKAEIKSGIVEFHSDYGNALGASGDINIYSPADVTADSGDESPAVYSGNDFIINGGNVEIIAPKSNAVFVDAAIKLKDGTVKASSYYPAFYATKQVDISGGDITAISTDDTAIYSKTDTIKISNDATVYAEAYYCALKAEGNTSEENAIVISGGKLTAISTADVAIYSPKGILVEGGDITATAELAAVRSNTGLQVKGGTLAAATKNPDEHYSVAVEGNFVIDGDAVVYLYDFTASDDGLIKGVLYRETDVSLDEDGKRVLKGGVGSVYGNPNVTDFVKPDNSQLGTIFDEYVTIEAPDVTYNGEIPAPHPVVKVEKTALTKTLTEGTDYNVRSFYGTSKDVGEKTYTITEASYLYSGQKDFSFNVVPAEISLITDNITVSKVEDGTKNAAKVSGTLNIKGVAQNDDVVLTYTDIETPDFPSAIHGSYPLTLTVKGATIEGEDSKNYVLNENTFDVTGTITCSAADENSDHKCDYCGDTVSEHNYKHGICTDCGAEDPDASFIVILFGRIINWFHSLFESIGNLFKSRIA